mmetsp:Transcript_844/g.2297  ORF Transcript_844/g.2297 Transcript_844/m.2297 type:complete len:483 (+) Transcript_844:1021-2469(+)
MAIAMAAVADHPRGFTMHVPVGAGAQLNLTGGAAVTMLPALPEGRSLADVCAETQFCRCGVVLRLPWSFDGELRGYVAFKVLDKAALKADGDMADKEVEAMARVAPRGLLACAEDGVSRPAPGMPRWDTFEDDLNVYIVTEWAEGGSLASWSRRAVAELMTTGQRDLWYSEHLPRMYHQLTEAMEHMHAHGVVHLDLDPKNCVMARNVHPTTGAVCYDLLVIDFGSARAVESPTTLVGDTGVKFKLRFMSPQVGEYYRRGTRFAGAPADVFQAGAILWWLLVLPIALSQREDDGTGRGRSVPVDEVALDMGGNWRRNLLSHFAEGHADQQAALAERAHETAAKHAAACEEAHACGLEPPAALRDVDLLPPYKPTDCMCCRWSFDIPNCWRQALWACLQDEPAERPTMTALREHITAICQSLADEEAAVAEAVAASEAEEMEEIAKAAAQQADLLVAFSKAEEFDEEISDNPASATAVAALSV